MNMNCTRKLLRIAILLFVFAVGSISSNAQTLISEGFDGATFPPTGWAAVIKTSGSAITQNWARCTGSCGYPASIPPHNGSAGEAWMYNFGSNTPSVLLLETPPLALQNYGNGYAQMSFWLYRMSGTYTGSYGLNNDKLSIYVNTAQNMNGNPTYLGVLSEYLSPGSFFGAGSAVTTPGWYQYTFRIPPSYNSAPAYVIFQDSSNYGYDLYMDDVLVQWIAPCTGTPSNPVITSAPLSAPVCSGASATITATDPNVAASLYNYWQQSPTGAAGTWVTVTTPAVAAASLTYVTPALIASGYYRLADSCGVTGQVGYSAAYAVPVQTYAITYSENFNTTLNTFIPNCFTENITTSGQSRWQVNTVFKDANSVSYPAVIEEDDVAGNFTNGKNAFFTLPALVMNAGQTYRIKFGYERGRSDYLTTNALTTFPENLQLFANFGVQPITSVQGSPGGTNLFNTTVTVEGHNTATLTYTPATTGAYFFSWYSNTPHPAGGATQAGGLIAVDSIKIDSFGCNLPVIAFQPQNTATCLNGTTTISVGATGYNLSYQWFKGASAIPLTNGGSISGATTNTLTFTNTQLSDAASYKVVVTGTCGGTTIVTSNSVNLNVSLYPTDTITTSTPTTFCAGGSVVLTANTGTGNNYQWKLNGNFIPNAFGSTYTASASGTYQSVSTNPTGCAATSLPVAVNVLSASTVSISPSGPTTFCNGGTVTLTANTGAGIHYSWTKNGSPLVPADTTNVLTTTTAGSYNVTETAGTSPTCSASFPTPVVVTVNGPTAPPVLSASGPLAFCLGGFVTLSTPNIAQPGYTYQWYQNNNAITGANSTNFTASASGIYKVNVSQNNCALSSFSDTVAVDAPPTTISNNGTIICSGNTIVLSAPSGYHYQWLNNGVPVVPADTTNILTTTSGGNYQVTVTDAYPCTATSSVVPVTVGAPPSAVIQAAGPTTFCPGGSVTINANVDTSLNYIWLTSSTGFPGSFGVTASSPGTGPNGHHDYSHTYNYSTFVKVVESNGPCVDTTSFAIQVIVSPVPAPTITPSASTLLCPGASVTLNTQLGTGLTYQWYNGTTAIPTAITNSLVVNAAGSYHVIATNSVGCTGSSPQQGVTTAAYPTAAITTIGSDSVCVGSPVSLVAASATGNTYQWYLNNQLVVPSPGASYTPSPNVNSSVYVSVTSSAGCVATSSPVALTVFPIPSTNVFASASTTFCAGNSVVLSAVNAAGLTYQWQTNPVSTWVNINGATHYNDTVTTTSSYRVVISNGICPVASIVVPVMVSAAPGLNITTNASTTLCKGGSVTLTATQLNGVNYQWKIDNNNIPNAVGVTYTATQSGTYTVVASGNNCTSTSPPEVVVVNALPIDTVISTSVRAHVTCAGTSDTLIDEYSYPGFTYQWNLNGGVVAGQTNPYVFAFDSGLYTVTVTDTNGCTNTSPSFAVTQLPLPNPIVIVNGDVLSTGTFVSYLWFMNDVAMTSNPTTNNSITITGSGKYKVMVTDGNGCSNTSTDIYVVGVGVNNVISKDQVKIYPNPATSIVHIDAPVKVNVAVSGIDGRLMIKGNGVNQLDLSSLSSGVYMITVSDENNNVIRIDKLVKAGW